MTAERPAGSQVLGGHTLPVLCLLFNAAVWGVSWWPLRQLQALGLHPLWATALIFLLAVVGIGLWRRAAWRQLAGTRSLWMLVLAAGTTNACFNWAVTTGDVVRVVLLFYLMPLWAVLLARLLLHEALTLSAGVRVLMALAGAAIVLWPAQGGWPLPDSLPEWLAVLGGFSFALNNVLLKREARQPAAARALAMFLGGMLVSMALAMVVTLDEQGGGLPPLAWSWLLGSLALGGLFVASNLALQFGAARLPAHVTAVVMLSEILFASVSAVLLGAGQISVPLVIGGILIVAATLLSLRD